jgi:hypothetical protein
LAENGERNRKKLMRAKYKNSKKKATLQLIVSSLKKVSVFQSLIIKRLRRQEAVRAVMKTIKLAVMFAIFMKAVRFVAII